jgi:hypothetical protein
MKPASLPQGAVGLAPLRPEDAGEGWGGGNTFEPSPIPAFPRKRGKELLRLIAENGVTGKVKRTGGVTHARNRSA